MDTWQFVMVVVLAAISGFFFGMAYNFKVIGQIKHENERLNHELHRLTDRDERGRFKGGK